MRKQSIWAVVAGVVFSVRRPEPSMTGRNVASISAFTLVIACGACRREGQAAGRQADSAFTAMQARGQTVMGVDQYASATFLKTW